MERRSGAEDSYVLGCRKRLYYEDVKNDFGANDSLKMGLICEYAFYIYIVLVPSLDAFPQNHRPTQ